MSTSVCCLFNFKPVIQTDARLSFVGFLDPLAQTLAFLFAFPRAKSNVVYFTVHIKVHGQKIIVDIALKKLEYLAVYVMRVLEQFARNGSHDECLFITETVIIPTIDISPARWEPPWRLSRQPLSKPTYSMMASSNENIVRVTGSLCGEFPGHRWIPFTKASDAELWCFIWSVPYLYLIERLSKPSRRR